MSESYLKTVFTGIVQAVGKVVEYSNSVLELTAPESFHTADIQEGESIAINGCCLTVVGKRGSLSFDLSPETVSRTSLGDLVPGSVVNLERAARVNSFLGGHIVQGHVDCTGEILSMEEQGNAVIVRFQAPAEYDRYLIDKGSVTIDGISLTVVSPESGAFDTWIIPHTMAETNLSTKSVGDRVNLEFDVVAKYVEKLLSARS